MPDDGLGGRASATTRHRCSPRPAGWSGEMRGRSRSMPEHGCLVDARPDRRHEPRGTGGWDLEIQTPARATGRALKPARSARGCTHGAGGRRGERTTAGGVHSHLGPTLELPQEVLLPCGHLATEKKSEPAGDRTQDLRIKSPLLYQLSYRLVVRMATPPSASYTTSPGRSAPVPAPSAPRQSSSGDGAKGRSDAAPPCGPSCRTPRSSSIHRPDIGDGGDA